MIVSAAGAILADTRSALVLREANYPPVHYIPREDADMAALACSATQSYCPYKGKASYFGIAALGERGADAVWSYEEPYDAVAPIHAHLAFYPDRVTITVED